VSQSPPQTPSVSLSLAEALQQAIACHKAGQLPEAERLYRAIMEMQPHHPDANHNLGVLAVGMGKLEAAVQFLRRALESNPLVGQYWVSYADALIRVGQADVARQVITAARQRGLEGEPIRQIEARLSASSATSTPSGSSPSWLSPAIALREEGRYREAAAWLNDWLATHTDDAEAMALLAHVLLLDKQDMAAQALLNRAQTIAPHLPAVQRNRARLLLRQSQPAAALTAAQTAYSSDPHNMEGQIVLARALGANQRHPEALLLVDRVVQDRPNYAESYSTRALIRLHANDAAGALADVEQALAIKPHLVELWSLLGSLRYQQKNLSGAVEALQKAVQYDPDNVGHMVVLGEFLRQDNQVNAAIAQLQVATDLAPDIAAAWTNLGLALQNAGRFGEAKSAYDRALEINPQSAEIASHIGALAMTTRKWEDAQHYLKQALAIKPDFPEALCNLGTVLKEQGKLAEAIAHYEQAVVIKPDFVEAHNGLGVVYSALGIQLGHQGKIEQAIVCYQRVLALDPTNSVAAHNMASIDGSHPESASQAYVVTQFDRFADTFDKTLVSHLKYEAPQILVGLIEDFCTSTADKWDVLDLGCGTGLVALAIHPYTRQLVGVDLSAKMLTKARERNLYQRLERSDLFSMMKGEPNSSYDAIVAADVFVYIGKLDGIVQEGARLLRPGGVFAFCVEAMESLSIGGSSNIGNREYILNITGRYAHSAIYMHKLARTHGFMISSLIRNKIRFEVGKPVDGHYAIFKLAD
jgi:predicted TPR repeat methyltransferase